MRFDQLPRQSTRAATGCAIALGFSIPISVALDNILLAAVLLLWLAGAGFREKFIWLAGHRVAQAAFALFVLLATGIVWSDQVNEGFRLLGKYADLAFIPVFVTLFRSPCDRRFAAWFLIAALVITLIVSCLTWTGLWPPGLMIIGDAREPEVFKKYLTQSVLTAYGAYLFALLARDAPSPRQRIIWSLLAALAVLNVVIMLPGRSGQIALALLTLLFAFSIWRVKGTALTGGALALVASIVILGYAPDNVRFNTVVKDFKAWQQDPSARTSTGQRLNYALNSANIVLDHPLVGVGTGGFADAYARQVEGKGIEATVNPHNEYLNIAVQLGVAGLAALGLLFVLAWRHADRLATALERDLARGLVLTFAVGCAFNSMLMDHVEGLFFAWGIGVLYGGYGASRPPAPSEAP